MVDRQRKVSTHQTNQITPNLLPEDDVAFLDRVGVLLELLRVGIFPGANPVEARHLRAFVRTYSTNVQGGVKNGEDLSISTCESRKRHFHV